MVEIDVSERGPTFEISTNTGLEEMDMNLKDIIPGLFGQRTRKRKMRVAEAAEYLVQEEEQKLIDMDQVTRVALDRVERNGIVFLDEIDKIAGREGGHGPDVSREGVQRDILPIVEGTTVNTRHGFVRTDHILFVAAGAFHVSKPSDLIPELQGRFPIRVELKSLTEADFIRILKEPKGALVKQYIALLDTEGIKLTFTDDAIEQIAAIRGQVNQASENIGARRLHTIMEKLLEEISFAGPGSEEEERAHRRGVCPQATGGHREGPGSKPVHFVADALSGRPHLVAHALLRAASPLLATPDVFFTVFARVRTRHVENVRHNACSSLHHRSAGGVRLHRPTAVSGRAHPVAGRRPDGGGARRQSRFQLHHCTVDHRGPAAQKDRGS